MAERTIAALRLTGAGRVGAIARAAAVAGALELGLDAASAPGLGDAAEVVVQSIAEHAFDDPEEVELEVQLLRRDDAVVVRVDDRGLPLAFRDEGDAFAQVLAAGAVDEAHHESRGAEGNRTELVRHCAATHLDIRTNADPDEHTETLGAPPADASIELTIRAMDPDDADGVARLTWRTYGYTYQHQEFYRPDLLRQVLSDGTMRSWIAATPGGEVVGHTSLVFDQPDALVAEGGRAMVDPRFRGHHVMKDIARLRAQHADDGGLFGFYADAVTAHTRSQMLYGGADQPVTGLLLGYLPPTVTFRRIDAASAPARRQAVVMSYHPRRPHDALTVFPPEASREVLRRIYQAHDLPRPFGDSDDLAAVTTSTLESRVWRDLGAALLIVHEPGGDLHDAVRSRLRSIRGAGVEVVYADLPLAHPVTPAAGAVLNRLGFSFGGVIPLLRDHGDVLRLQHVGELDVDPSEIELVSTMAKELLAFILDRRDAVS